MVSMGILGLINVFLNFENIKGIFIEQAYNIENLLFISLEFDKIIIPNKFQSKKLYNIHFYRVKKCIRLHGQF